MKCNRCGKVTDYYYKVDSIALCEDCACNSVSALADEGFFPFFDTVVAVHSWPDSVPENPASEPVPTELSDSIDKVVNDCMEKQKYMDPDKNLPEEYTGDPASLYQQAKSVLSSAYGMIAENT